jgi:hypothetical protein
MGLLFWIHAAGATDDFVAEMHTRGVPYGNSLKTKHFRLREYRFTRTTLRILTT